MNDFPSQSSGESFLTLPLISERSFPLSKLKFTGLHPCFPLALFFYKEENAIISIDLDLYKPVNRYSLRHLNPSDVLKSYFFDSNVIASIHRNLDYSSLVSKSFSATPCVYILLPGGLFVTSNNFPAEHVLQGNYRSQPVESLRFIDENLMAIALENFDLLFYNRANKIVFKVITSLFNSVPKSLVIFKSLETLPFFLTASGGNLSLWNLNDLENPFIKFESISGNIVKVLLLNSILFAGISTSSIVIFSIFNKKPLITINCHYSNNEIVNAIQPFVSPYSLPLILSDKAGHSYCLNLLHVEGVKFDTSSVMVSASKTSTMIDLSQHKLGLPHIRFRKLFPIFSVTDRFFGVTDTNFYDFRHVIRNRPVLFASNCVQSIPNGICLSAFVAGTEALWMKRVGVNSLKPGVLAHVSMTSPKFDFPPGFGMLEPFLSFNVHSRTLSIHSKLTQNLLIFRVSSSFDVPELILQEKEVLDVIFTGKSELILLKQGVLQHKNIGSGDFKSGCSTLFSIKIDSSLDKIFFSAQPILTSSWKPTLIQKLDFSAPKNLVISIPPKYLIKKTRKGGENGPYIFLGDAFMIITDGKGENFTSFDWEVVDVIVFGLAIFCLCPNEVRILFSDLIAAGELFYEEIGKGLLPRSPIVLFKIVDSLLIIGNESFEMIALELNSPFFSAEFNLNKVINSLPVLMLLAKFRPLLFNRQVLTETQVTDLTTFLWNETKDPRLVEGLVRRILVLPPERKCILMKDIEMDAPDLLEVLRGKEGFESI